jgi:hypothetical protein
MNMWRSSYKKLQADKQRFYNYANIMTHYELQTIKQSLQEQTDYLAVSIMNGALAEFNQAIAGYQAAAAKVGAAKAAELRSWDAAKLSAERQNIQQQIDLAFRGGKDPFTGKGPEDQIAVILAEAKQSGDIVRVRAASEVARAVIGKTSKDEAVKIASLASDLENSLATARVTPSMITAERDRISALNELVAKRNELPEISETVGWGDPTTDMFNTGSIARAMKKVRLSEDGNGVEILADDDPEICGIDMSKIA